MGAPSVQAPNLFGAAAIWELKHNGIEGMVPMIAATHFPDNPEKAHVLPVDILLTCDPNGVGLPAWPAYRGTAFFTPHAHISL